MTAGAAYGTRLEIRPIDSVITSMACFMAINFNTFAEGLDSSRFSVSNMFVGLVTVMLCIKLFKFLVDKKIAIKLPDVVPENIGAVFTAMIPTMVCILICWIIRTVLDFDFVTWMTEILT